MSGLSFRLFLPFLYTFRAAVKTKAALHHIYSSARQSTRERAHFTPEARAKNNRLRECSCPGVSMLMVLRDVDMQRIKARWR